MTDRDAPRTWANPNGSTAATTEAERIVAAALLHPCWCGHPMGAHTLAADDVLTVCITEVERDGHRWVCGCNGYEAE